MIGYARAVNRAVAPAFALLAACFSPEPPPGAPCAPDQRCPTPLVCIANACQRPGAQPDGTAGGPDGSGSDTPLQCPGGFAKSRSGACLLDVPFDPLSWPQAEAACEQRGAHLAVPDSTAEATELATPPRWIGVTDRVVAGTYRTVTGAVASFTYWDSGEPRGGTTHCAYVGGIEARWRTSSCDFPFPYTCEYDGRAAAPDAF